MKTKLFASGYHHHWKLMTAFTAVIFLGIIVAFLSGSILWAVVLSLGFAIFTVQWLTIDPPDITDEDVDGPTAKRSGKP